MEEIFEVVDKFIYQSPNVSFKRPEGRTYWRQLLSATTATGIQKSNPLTIMSMQVWHPLTCIVSSLSWSGKLTFVCNVPLKQKDLIDTEFDNVYIFLGTSAFENKTLSMIGAELCQRGECVRC